MRGQPGFFDIDDRLKRLSDLGDQLEAFRSAVDFELFRPELSAALGYTDRTEGGRPPFDPVLMFKILVIQATNNLSDERAEFLINVRLSFMRFLGLGLEDRVPDARTIWLFREKLTTKFRDDVPPKEHALPSIPDDLSIPAQTNGPAVKRGHLSLWWWQGNNQVGNINLNFFVSTRPGPTGSITIPLKLFIQVYSGSRYQSLSFHFPPTFSQTTTYLPSISCGLSPLVLAVI